MLEMTLNPKPAVMKLILMAAMNAQLYCRGRPHAEKNRCFTVLLFSLVLSIKDNSCSN